MIVEALLAPCVFSCKPQDFSSYKEMEERIATFFADIDQFSDFIYPIMPKDIYDDIMEQWPFNVQPHYIGDERIDTNTLISAFSDMPINRIRYNYNIKQNINCCIQSDISNKWLGFIIAWKENSSREKGIYPTTHCSIAEIEHIKVVHNIFDWKLIAFPWLEKTSIYLPVGGDTPYIPPKNWKRMNLKRKVKINRELCYGYIDINNNIWVWDKMHKNHWDVQQGEKHKTYKKVYLDYDKFP